MIFKETLLHPAAVQKIALALPRRCPQRWLERVLAKPVEYTAVSLRIEFDQLAVVNALPDFNVEDWYCDCIVAEREPQYRQILAFNVHMGNREDKRYRHDKGVTENTVWFSIAGAPQPVRPDQFDRLHPENLRCSVSLVRIADGSTAFGTELVFNRGTWEVA